MSTDGDTPIPPSEVRRLIGRMLAGLAARPGRDAGRGGPTKPATRRAPQDPPPRVVIKGYDPADPKLAEVLAELDAKRAGKAGQP